MVPPLDRECAEGTTRTTWRTPQEEGFFQPPSQVITFPRPLPQGAAIESSLPDGWDPLSGTSLIFDTYFVEGIRRRQESGTRWALRLQGDFLGPYPTIAATEITHIADFKILAAYSFARYWDTSYKTWNGDPAYHAAFQAYPPPLPPDGSSRSRLSTKASYLLGFYSIDEDLAKVTIILKSLQYSVGMNLALCQASGRAVYFRDGDTLSLTVVGDDSEGQVTNDNQGMEVGLDDSFESLQLTVSVLDYLV